jgi:plastocyanin
MTKKIFLLTFSLSFVFLLTGCASNSNTNQVVNQDTNQSVNQPVVNQPVVNQPIPPVTPQTQSITIKNFAFNPNNLVIKAGTIVKWTNNDSVGHQIKSNSFNSTVLNSGDSFEIKFDIVGTYDYSCAIHPSMTGKITVE